MAAVVGPSIAIATWFVLTWYYRSEKKIIADEVIRRLRIADICKADSAVAAKPAEAISAAQHMNATQSRGFNPEDSANERYINADMVRSGSFTSAVSATSDEKALNGALTPEMKKVARQITQRCLRRWDGLLGIRASSDSLGNRAGIWRDRFDTVRCAVLLLAFKNLNEALQANPASFREDRPGQLHLLCHQLMRFAQCLT